MQYYTRYMDDCVLLHHNRQELQTCRDTLRKYAAEELGLSFNEKTQIIPIKNGVEYLGFRFSLGTNGKVVRKLSKKTKTRFKHRVRKMQQLYACRRMDWDQVKEVMTSYHAHLSKGHTFRLWKSVNDRTVFTRN